MNDKSVNVEDRLDKIFEYIEKNLHVTCRIAELYESRSARPYYPLNDKWALTSLDTGHPFFVNTEDRNITPWIIMGGHWERNVGNVLLDYISLGMNVLDVGANMGYYTVKFASKVGPTGRCLSFEPNPEVYSVCLENIKINGLSGNTSLYTFALGDQEGVAVLTRSNSNMASANLIGEQNADYSVKVDVKRLDDVIPQNLVVDMIKLDAEGYEKKILDGAIKTLRRSPECAIVIEVNLERWERSAPLSSLVDSCGGDRELFAIDDSGFIRSISPSELREFLQGCAYHENYFLVAKRKQVEEKISHLLVH